MSKTICIYHNNCFDGICSAWVVWKKYPDAEFIPMTYNNQKFLNGIEQDCYENANINDKYIFVDFSIPAKYLKMLANKAMGVLVIDHHQTAEKELSDLAGMSDICEVIFDMNESGASLAWKYFFPGEQVPMLVRYVKDRDLWLFKEQASHEINAFIQSFPMTLDSYQALYKTLQDPTGRMYAETGGEAIERYKKSRVLEICKTARIASIGGYYVPIVNTSVLFSEVPSELCKLFPDSPFAAYYYDRAEGIRQYGLRSVGDFDVSNVAKMYGGGGHKNAAGFEVKFGIDWGSDVEIRRGI